MKPSTRGAVPEGWVPRRGGHAQVSAELGGDASSHHGLAVILQEDGTLAITWRSEQLNRGPNNLVPTNIRPKIVEAVETLTGRTVSTF